jgi:uncharacterized membrane protein
LTKHSVDIRTILPAKVRVFASDSFKQVRTAISANKPIVIMVLTYCIALSAITIWKERAFLTSGFDLGIFNQAFWSTLFKQNIFYETGDLSFNPAGSFLGVHFSPILFLLLPIYGLYPAPETLLVMQTVVLAIGVFPIYWMSRDKLGQKAALAVSSAYLINPLLLFININDFHLEAFTSTFFLFALYFLHKEEWPKFTLFLVLALSTLEFAPILGIAMAAYAFILLSKNSFTNPTKARKYIFITVALSALVFALAYITKASFNPTTSPLPSPFHSVFANPVGVLATDYPAKLFYLISIFAPLGFLPLLAPEALIMVIPWLATSLLSTYPGYYSVYYQYQGFVVPFLFLALIISLKRLNFQSFKKIIAVLVIPTLLFSAFFLTASNVPWNYRLTVANDGAESANTIMQLIPPDASILTQNDLFPQISGRTQGYMYLPQNSNISVDYVLGNVNSQWYTWSQPDVFGERDAPSAFTETSLRNNAFGVYASSGTVFLLKRGYLGSPLLFEPFTSEYNFQNLKLTSGSIVTDPSSRSKNVLLRNQTESTENFWYGPYANLPMGTYKVTYSIKITNSTNLNPSDQLLNVYVTSDGGKVLLSEKHVFCAQVPAFGEWFNVTLPFGLIVPTTGVEFKADATGLCSISVDYIYVQQLSPQPSSLTEQSLIYSDLFLSQGSIKGNVITHLNGSGTLWYGPYTSLKNGNYTANFWLKLDSTYHGNIMDLAVTKDSGQTLLAIAHIYGDDFKAVDEWQKFEVKFSLNEDLRGLEFSGINVVGQAPVSFLLVEVQSDDSG